MGESFCCGGVGFSASFMKASAVWGSAEHLTVSILLLGLFPLKMEGFVRVTDCVLSFSRCFTDPDGVLFLGGNLLDLVVLAVCC